MAEYLVSQACILTKHIEADSYDEAVANAFALAADEFTETKWGLTTVTEVTA
jgi:hypothetical protein